MIAVIDSQIHDKTCVFSLRILFRFIPFMVKIFSKKALKVMHLMEKLQNKVAPLNSLCSVKSNILYS